MAAPNWQARVDAAHTLLRETVEPTRFEFDPGQFTDMATPTKLLTGSESPAYYKEGTWAVHGMLPHSRISVIQGHGHVAMNSGTGSPYQQGSCIGFRYGRVMKIIGCKLGTLLYQHSDLSGMS